MEHLDAVVHRDLEDIVVLPLERHATLPAEARRAVAAERDRAGRSVLLGGPRLGRGRHVDEDAAVAHDEALARAHVVLDVLARHAEDPRIALAGGRVPVAALDPRTALGDELVERALRGADIAAERIGRAALARVARLRIDAELEEQRLRVDRVARLRVRLAAHLDIAAEVERSAGFADLGVVELVVPGRLERGRHLGRGTLDLARAERDRIAERPEAPRPLAARAAGRIVEAQVAQVVGHDIRADDRDILAGEPELSLGRLADERVGEHARALLEEDLHAALRLDDIDLDIAEIAVGTCEQSAAGGIRRRRRLRARGLLAEGDHQVLGPDRLARVARLDRLLGDEPPRNRIALRVFAEEELEPLRHHRAVATEPAHADAAGARTAVGDDRVDPLGVARTERDLEAVGVHLELAAEHIDAAAEARERQLRVVAIARKAEIDAALPGDLEFLRGRIEAELLRASGRRRIYDERDRRGIRGDEHAGRIGHDCGRVLEHRHRTRRAAGERHATAALEPAFAVAQRGPEAGAFERHARIRHGQRRAFAPVRLDALVAHAVAEPRADDARRRASVDHLDARTGHIEADVVLRRELVGRIRRGQHDEPSAEGDGDAVGRRILQRGERERNDGERGGCAE